MDTAAAIVHLIVRYLGLVMLALGVAFWTGHALDLISLHMLLGIIFTLALWTLAALAARAGAPLGFVAFVFVWGFVLIGLGMTQMRLLVGDAHWVIQVVHLLVGMAAIGQGEGLYRRMVPPAVRALRV